MPFPRPAPTAMVKQPAVYKPMEGEKASRIAAIVSPTKTAMSKNSGLNLSASQPPTGRKQVATTIKPAVRIPASTLESSKCDTKKFGR
ncbi:hypothetical protein CM49_05512 [Paenibacillus sp. P1XP2]|nr:hypothetical protein CM49_05512 [Paenibacillus sp. P1XP2]